LPLQIKGIDVKIALLRPIWIKRYMGGVKGSQLELCPAAHSVDNILGAHSIRFFRALSLEGEELGSNLLHVT
jgi:hypothetical protein